jgi:hypothetical protein
MQHCAAVSLWLRAALFCTLCREMAPHRGFGQTGQSEDTHSPEAC